MTTVVTPLKRLADAHGRVARDLRMSLTDRCNLRCTYCMPADGLAWLPTPEVLTDAEVVRLVGVAVEQLGVRKIRFTGGEPLLRRGLARHHRRRERPAHRRGPAAGAVTDHERDRPGPPGLRAGCRRAEPGEHLPGFARPASATPRWRDATGWTRCSTGLAAADAAGLRPVKVNAVVMRGVNEVDVVPLAEFCLQRGYRLRFIEQMPIGPQHGWDRASMVPAAEILELLGGHFALSPQGRPRVGTGGGMAGRRRRLPPVRHGRGDRLGHRSRSARPATAPASPPTARCAPACSASPRPTCARRCAPAPPTRTSQTCGPGAHRGKWAGHSIGRADFRQPDRTMSAIGG